MADLTGRGAVVITGASTGIGRACALDLDGRGFRVFAGVRKDEDGERLRSERPSIEPLRIDVTDAGEIAAARDRVSEEVGTAGLAGLVNNAGIAVPGPLEHLPIDEFRRQMEVNLVGQVAVTQAFLPLLRTARGRVVNIGSIGGRVALPMLGPYAASKHAMEGISDSLRRELRPWGIAGLDRAARPDRHRHLGERERDRRRAPGAHAGRGGGLRRSDRGRPGMGGAASERGRFPRARSRRWWRMR